SLSHGVRGLMGRIAYLAFGRAEQLILAPLQALPAPRAFGLGCLRLLDIRQGLVAPLDDGFHSATTDEENLRAVGSSEHGIHAQIHTDDRLLGAGDVWHFTDQAHDSKRQPELHQSPGSVMVAGNRMRNVPLVPWGKTSHPSRIRASWLV